MAETSVSLPGATATLGTKKVQLLSAGATRVKIEHPDPPTLSVHIIQAADSSKNVQMTPNILKRSRPMTSTPTPPSGGSLKVCLGSKKPRLANPNYEKEEKSKSYDPLSLLADEAARRSPSLFMSPPLASKFISGPFIEGEEQIDVRKGEIVCQKLSNSNLNGLYVFLLVHSHREYRSTPIVANTFDGFKEDQDAYKRWPLRAWTDSCYNETEYKLLDIPKLGTHNVAIVHMRNENVINLRFPVLSSDRNNNGHKKQGRLWEQLVFPFDKLKNAYEHWLVTPIQVVAELRDPKKLKKPKRGLSRSAVIPMPYTYGMPASYGNALVDGNNSSGDDNDESIINVSDDPKLMIVDVKPEPKFEETSLACRPEEWDEEKLTEEILVNTRRACQMLPRDMLILEYFKSLSNLEAVKTLLSVRGQATAEFESFSNQN